MWFDFQFFIFFPALLGVGASYKTPLRVERGNDDYFLFAVQGVKTLH